MNQDKLNRAILIKSIILGLMILMVILSGVFFKGSELSNMPDANQAPSWQHLFGTDNLGRDLLARSFVGLRLSLLMAVIVQVICLAAGVVIGTVCAYVGGLLDKCFVFLQGVILSFPGTVVTLCIMMLFGTGIPSMILALSIFGWLTYARLTRSQVLHLRSANYIMGERAIGSSFWRIQLYHIVPAVARTLIPMFTLMIGHAVLGIAGLSFLGFGVQPPNAEIGLMIQDGLTYMRSAPWMFLAPGLLLAFYTVMFNSLGDSLQDRFDPHDNIGVSKM